MRTRSSIVQRLAAAAVVAVTAVAGVAVAAGPAVAAEAEPLGSKSASTGFSNGARLNANAWWQQFIKNGCFDFETSAVITGGHSPVSGRDWVRNTTSFTARGVNSSLKGFGQSGKTVTGQWTNNNGSRGSYLSGAICVNIWTLWVEVFHEATAFYNGQTRIVSVSA